MKKYILLLFALCLGTAMAAQKGNQKLLPLGVEISVEILEVDSLQLEFYNLYKFRYHSQGGELVHVFQTDKDFPILTTGPQQLRLCRIYRVKKRYGNTVSVQGKSCEIYEQWVLGYADMNIDDPMPSESAIFLQACKN